MFYQPPPSRNVRANRWKKPARRSVARLSPPKSHTQHTLVSRAPRKLARVKSSRSSSCSETTAASARGVLERPTKGRARIKRCSANASHSAPRKHNAHCVRVAAPVPMTCAGSCSDYNRRGSNEATNKLAAVAKALTLRNPKVGLVWHARLHSTISTPVEMPNVVINRDIASRRQNAHGFAYLSH